MIGCCINGALVGFLSPSLFGPRWWVACLAILAVCVGNVLATSGKP